MNIWRLFRLPGSRQYWHIDSGPGTYVINVTGYRSDVPNKSVDIGGANVPRAWIEFDAEYCDLHIIDGIAAFSFKTANMPEIVPDSSKEQSEVTAHV